jgi:hypothetical protein
MRKSSSRRPLDVEQGRLPKYGVGPTEEIFPGVHRSKIILIHPRGYEISNQTVELLLAHAESPATANAILRIIAELNGLNAENLLAEYQRSK